MNIAAELNNIRRQHGTLTRRNVVDTAADPGHPLHDQFEWDDTIAGDKYRLHQAGQLLRVTIIEPTPGQQQEIRAFIAQPSQDRYAHEYVPVREAAENKFSAELMLRNMKRDWMTFKRRYDQMAEFVEFIQNEITEESA